MTLRADVADIAQNPQGATSRPWRAPAMRQLLLDLGHEAVPDLGAFLPGANACLLYTSPSPRDKRQSRMPSSA